MSENILTHYPTFQPNQVLSDAQLNELRNYLDQQNRLTRTRLIGCGIVCGLHALLENRDDGEKRVADPIGQKNIRISPGLAITSDGYLVEVASESVYAYYRVYDGTDEEGMRDWVCKDNPDKNISANARQVYELSQEGGEGYEPLTGQFIWDRVLILFWDRTVEDRTSCAVTDCSNKGANHKFVLRALLVSADCLEPNLKCKPEKPQPIFIPRLFTADTLRYDPNEPCPLATIDTTREIREAYGSLAKQTARILAECLTDLLKKLVNLREKEEDNKTVYVWDKPDFLNVSNVQDTIDSLFHINNPNSIFSRGAHHYHQYHYDFVRDLTCAYNEFLEAWCLLIKDCSPCYGYGQHVMVREFVENKSPEHIEYRHWFTPASTRDAFHDKWHHARALFVRIIKMIEAFDVEGMESLGSLRNFKNIAITPSQSALHKLGKQSLPFYYRLYDSDNVSTQIDRYWQPEDCCTIDPLYSYHYFEPDAAFRHQRDWTGDYNYATFGVHFDLQKHSQLRIEGHIGKDPRVVIPCIEGFRKDYNLDFDCLVLYLTETIPASGQELREDLGDDYFTIRTFKNFVREYLGIEHCNGIGRGETFILVVDPFCPGFDDDIVVADFTLPFRISCCLSDDERDVPKLPYVDEEGIVTIDLRKPNETVATGASIYLLDADSGAVVDAFDVVDDSREVPEVNPSIADSWHVRFEGLMAGKQYGIYASLLEGDSANPSVKEVCQRGVKADVRGTAQTIALVEAGSAPQIRLEVIAAPSDASVNNVALQLRDESGNTVNRTLSTTSNRETYVFEEIVNLSEFYSVSGSRPDNTDDGPGLFGELNRIVATYDQGCTYMLVLNEAPGSMSAGNQSVTMAPRTTAASASGPIVKASTPPPPKPRAASAEKSKGTTELADLFGARLNAAVTASSKSLPDVSAGTREASEELLAGSSLKGGALNTAYLSAFDKISRGFRQSKNQKKKVAYGTLLLPLTSVYLDRIVEQSPNALSRTDSKAIENAVALLKEADQLDRLIRSWDANKLRANTGAPVIDAIEKLIG